ncbi:MAG: hypothetical protein JWO80_4824 [Bryobacterales bacterium]|nr:hypothetical protein [Bryobacterales bacterium]
MSMHLKRTATILNPDQSRVLHNGELIIPYGLADHATGFATIALAEVLAAMEQESPLSA